ncbi:asparaginase [Histidinibacterium lentulum]|uniref:Asparaginase n=1 Tax=Histidinibacterium lentulum TaxID=2480588 RepID=A0A3N2R5K8_9RHOB|nr:asparaginase [Histidinibacterium lentulum]ROU02769.1 asparaginase [Histidinibacterium lentulum]
MSTPADLVELTRGDRRECLHRGHAVIADASGAVLEAWGDPGIVIYPRSSLKPIQALPLAEALPDLAPRRLALACASHEAAQDHTDLAAAWLTAMDHTSEALLCGPEEPRDRPARDALIRAHGTPGRIHNNCSGKHTGFLQLSRHLGAGPDYCDPAHPVQRRVRDALEDLCGEISPGYGIDGCSAPNFAVSLRGLARAMARFATASGTEGREGAMVRIREAMTAHPELVAGEGRACTELMRACAGRAAIKGGAEGVNVAMLPGPGLGIALKIEDGAARASECTLAALLVRLGAADPAHPAVAARLAPELRNWAGLAVGRMRSLI